MPKPVPLAEPRRAAPAAAALLRALREGTAITEPCVLVVAHPDDETLGVGSRLAAFRDLRLVHLTPGAPRDDGDARRAGFASSAAYAAAREAELEAALHLLHARPRRHGLGCVDGEVVHALAGVVDRLEPLLEGCAAVMTHPYEGGHPDHDAAAAAVQLACLRLAGREGRPAPLRLEFAGYHLERGEQVCGAFWDDPARPEVRPAISAGQLAAKRAAFAAYGSQASVLEWFTPEAEAYREAPDYDFAAPPPPGEALYDRWGWALTSARWREAAALAMGRLAVA